MLEHTKRIARSVCVAGIMIFISHCHSNGDNNPVVTETVPNFSLTDTNGVLIELNQFKGKPMILEWTNHLCPFVEKHYNSNKMQSLQKKYAEEGVVWLTIISSTEGKQGHVNAEQANKLTSERNASPTHVLLDTDGKVGRLFGAETTPHIFIIDSDSKLIYKGAIDSIRSTDVADIEKAVNYVDQVMSELNAGQPISVQETKAYGCAIKY